MTRARKELISLADTSYYHCVARCVRRAFLCGFDEFSGQDFEHRRQWVVDRLFKLADSFAIDVASYAIMSNHYHVILAVDQERSDGWSENEVIDRWCRLFNGHVLVDRYRQGETLDRGQQLKAEAIISEWRSRLCSVSWFMRCLNEYIARKANEEDQCKGRFWEGRFRSQALLDEQALLTCMTYVDLNPVRAGIARCPETSDFTAIQERIKQSCQPSAKPRLLEFIGDESKEPSVRGIHFHLQDYLQLADWTGRAIRDDKRGAVAQNIPPVLHRLNIDPNEWQHGVKYFGHHFPRLAGKAERLLEVAGRLGQSWCHGLGQARRLYV